jgi:hypothetical protein
VTPFRTPRPARRCARSVVVGGVAVTTVLVLNGVALAYRLASVSASGTGPATVSSGAATLAITASSTAGLYPGGPAGSVTITVQNTYPKAITITSLVAGTPTISGATGTCTNADISVVAPTTGLPLTVAAGTTSAATVLTGSVKMGTNAQNGCQGATITVPFTVRTGS